jgi:flagellar motor switch protein FliN/FliY
MDELNQNSVDDLVAQLQNEARNIAQTATQAVQSAAQTAQEIAGELRDAPRAPLAAGEHLRMPTSGGPTEAMGEGLGGSLPNGDLLRLLAIEVPVIVQLGRRRMTVSEVMRFAVGAIIEFNKSADEDLELLVNNKTIGKGHAVKVGENFGIRISNIGSVKETIRKLGGA